MAFFVDQVARAASIKTRVGSGVPQPQSVFDVFAGAETGRKAEFRESLPGNEAELSRAVREPVFDAIEVFRSEGPRWRRADWCAEGEFHVRDHNISTVLPLCGKPGVQSPLLQLIV